VIIILEILSLFTPELNALLYVPEIPRSYAVQAIDSLYTPGRPLVLVVLQILMEPLNVMQTHILAFVELVDLVLVTKIVLMVESVLMEHVNLELHKRNGFTLAVLLIIVREYLLIGKFSMI
jgi:hypothetical protein